jgi:hypothetical protein
MRWSFRPTPTLKLAFFPIGVSLLILTALSIGFDLSPFFAFDPLGCEINMGRNVMARRLLACKLSYNRVITLTAIFGRKDRLRFFLVRKARIL